jgi:homoserine kinase
LSSFLRIQAPATVAHLGPGLGVLGLALDLQAELDVDLDPPLEAGGDDADSIQIERVAEDGSTVSPRALDNRHDALLRAMRAAARRLGLTLPSPMALTLTTAFPHGVGLGSNAAEFALGIVAAVEIAKLRPAKGTRKGAESDEPMDTAAWLRRCSKDLELLYSLGGDPAHGAAVLAGGLAAAMPWSTEGIAHEFDRALPAQQTAERQMFRVLRMPLDPGWVCVLAIPEAHHGAADVHRLLPPSLTNSVAQRTVGRFAGLLEALATGDEELLRAGMHDEVHVPHRKRLVPGIGESLRAAIDAGAAAATLAGHGPALVAWTRDLGLAATIGEAMRDAFVTAGVDAGTIVCRPHFDGVSRVADDDEASGEEG